MASGAQTPGTARRISITPGSRILDVSSTPSTNGNGNGNGNGRFEDTSIWKRIRDAGFDDDSVRRRDKAALISYIAKLEAEMYELQHNMGLLILEKKDSASKYDEAVLSAEKAEVRHMREQAALLSAIAEARKREDSLRKALGVEKECVANIEKALHELRAESAEVKVSAEMKMAEARRMVEDAQLKFAEAEVKLRTAESLQDEAKRSERAAARKLQEAEAREDDLRRRLSSFKSDCDAKEKELMLERQSLAERQRVLSESQNKLLDSQALLNQREADILSKSQALKKLERELDLKKENIADEMRALIDQKSDLELNALSLSEREKVLVETEVLLSKKEQELIVSQEVLANKEHRDIQNILAEQEIALQSTRDKFEAEILEKRKTVEEDIEKKRRAWELREFDLKQREELILEKEQDLEVQSRVITDKGKDLAEKMKNVQERECHLNKSETEIELTKSYLQKEKEEFDKAKIDLQTSLISLEAEKMQITEEKKRLELMKSETSELFVLETKLKEEIDMIRAQKQQLDEEAEKLMTEKSKFETEWEIIDVKREELRREEERIAGEREQISKFLKDGRDSLNLEKEALRNQYKQDMESLAREREAFMSESQHERSDSFSKFQKERADFLLEIECRKRELEDCVNQRREDIESNLREKERIFEEEKKRDLQYIASLKEDLIKEQERVATALKKLEMEKLEIKLDREQRDKAWAELQNLIDELQMQRLKLKEQREMLHADRAEICTQANQLKDLEDVRIDTDATVVPHMQNTFIESTPQVFSRVPPSNQTHELRTAEDMQDAGRDSPPSSSFSWLKKCATLIFKNPSEEMKDYESSLDSAREDDEQLGSVERELLRIDEKIRKEQEVLIVAPSIEYASQPSKTGSDEPKVIHEVPSINEEGASLEVRKDVNESFVPGARKRRVGILSDSELENDAMSKKKRRQEGADTHDGCAESKQPSDDGQHVVSSSSQSELSKEKVVNSLAEAEKLLNISSEIVDAGISHAQFQQSQVAQSVLIEDEVRTCIVTEQTVVQELHVLNVGEANKSTEKAPSEEKTESQLSKQDEEPSEAKVDKPEAAKQRGKRRAKSKKKV
ncbi:hypothetical protein vseg_019562 [Gypsophila vaccaria]